MEQYRMCIGGNLTESAAGRWMDSKNPFSGKVWAKMAQGRAEDAGHAVQTIRQGSAARTTSMASKSYLHVKSIWMISSAPSPNPYAPR